MILNHHGIAVPRLGLGTWQLVGDDCTDSVQTALDLGYRHIDTAQAYENEELVGAAIASSPVPRDDIFLTTKVWRSRVGERFESSVDDSLRKLQTDYVDLLLIHWPVEETPLDEQLDALERVRQAGKARLVGVSNYTVDWLDRAAEHDVPLATNQVEYHPWLSQEPVREALRSRGMFLTAYSPLARGRKFDDPTLAQIANNHGVHPATVLIAWLLTQPDVVAIPKSTGRKHLASNFAALQLELSADEVDAITKLRDPNGRMINPGFSPAWDTGMGQPV